MLHQEFTTHEWIWSMITSCYTVLDVVMGLLPLEISKSWIPTQPKQDCPRLVKFSTHALNTYKLENELPLPHHH